MKNGLEQFKKLIRFLFIIILIAVQSGVFAHYWFENYNELILIAFAGKGNVMMIAFYAAFLAIFLYFFDGFKFGIHKTSSMAISQVLSVVATNTVVYLQIVLMATKFITVIPIIKVAIIDLVFALIMTFLGNFVFHRCFPARKLLLIYEDYEPSGFIKKVASRKDKYIIDKVVNVSEGLEKIEELIESAQGVIIYDVHSEMRNKILKFCFKHDVRTYTTTKVSDVLVRGAERLHLFDTPLLLYRNTGLTIEQRFFKRLMDIIVSLVLLIITSPLLLISALAIKLYDGGPVFYLQERLTIGGNPFKIHKFRSMIVNAEKDGAPQLATERDPRITPVGRILRASRLDELPQLIDILIGNMSLVGPRPERGELTEKFTEMIPEFEYRLKVRGGLTGYAQLYGKYNTSPYDKLQLDLIYIQNYSLLLDIQLILMTVKIMFMKESTEGVTEETNESFKKDKKE
ncbi:MAG: sugar transferase [Clostridia bacterium]|nr:sugar transferase [Clostridia bacterium]